MVLSLIRFKEPRSANFRVFIEIGHCLLLADITVFVNSLTDTVFWFITASLSTKCAKCVDKWHDKITVLGLNRALIVNCHCNLTGLNKSY